MENLRNYALRTGIENVYCLRKGTGVALDNGSLIVLSGIHGDEVRLLEAGRKFLTPIEYNWITLV